MEGRNADGRMDGQEKWISRKNSYNEGTKEGTNERTREMETEGTMERRKGRKDGERQERKGLASWAKPCEIVAMYLLFHRGE